MRIFLIMYKNTDLKFFDLRGFFIFSEYCIVETRNLSFFFCDFFLFLSFRIKWKISFNFSVWENMNERSEYYLNTIKDKDTNHLQSLPKTIELLHISYIMWSVIYIDCYFPFVVFVDFNFFPFSASTDRNFTYDELFRRALSYSNLYHFSFNALLISKNISTRYLCIISPRSLSLSWNTARMALIVFASILEDSKTINLGFFLRFFSFSKISWTIPQTYSWVCTERIPSCINLSAIFCMASWSHQSHSCRTRWCTLAFNHIICII